MSSSVDADGGGGHDSTIVLDSSASDLDETKEFQPVKPGGKLLDTIDISDSEEEEEDGHDDSTHYMTTNDQSLSFRTPAVEPDLHSTAIDASDGTPRRPVASLRDSLAQHCST